MRRVSIWLLVAAGVAGWISDVAPKRAPVTLGGYRVLAADFHVHTAPFSGSTLWPWDVVIEARRQGLDALAITGHNETLTGKLARAFAEHVGGITVLPGEEIHGPRYHMIAIGITQTISWRLSAAAAIDEIHRQGGFAIAAHPVSQFWPAFDPQALAKLDGSEVLQPVVYASEEATRQVREFYRRKPMTAIGSSDYHGLGPVGLCRTYVFARENSAESILEALRARRTVVIDRGAAFGDPELIRLMADNGQFVKTTEPRSLAATFSRFCAIAGLIGLILCGFPLTAR